MFWFRRPSKLHRWQPPGATPWWPMMLMFIPLLLLAGLGFKGLQVSRHAARETAEREIQRTVLRASEGVETALATARSVPGPRLYPLPPLPSPASPALELYQQALDADSEDASFALLARAADVDPDALTESGISLLPLIEWRRLQITADRSEWIERAENLARSAVETHPSVLTPEWLTHAELFLRERGLETNLLEPWRKRWAAEEQVRMALRDNASILATTGSPSWIRSDGEFWWAEPSADPSGWRLLPKSQLASIAAASLREAAELLPDYASLQVSLGGTPLLPERAGEALAEAKGDAFLVAGMLDDPAKLYAQQRQQTLWLAALLGCAVLAACGGTWMMNAALARERQLNALKSDFVSSISHELRAPVASMRIMAENLASGIVPDESRRREYHQLIADECWRLGTLIENVLDLARIERDRKTYHFAEADVGALTHDAVQLLQPRAAQRRQEIRLESEPIETPPVCDSLAVQQALINLLDNAIKFSPEQTLITVRLTGCGAMNWQLEVIDQGPGVPVVEQANIFDRFYRLGAELRRETQGTGIGLSIVKHIVEGHGGSVSVENQPAGGASFTLLLPCMPPGLHPELNISCRAS